MKSLVAQLDRLDAALEQIVCYSEIFSDLATANQATGSGQWIAEWLPKHHAHEETTLLQTIARMTPELASFAREMKRQHTEMRIRLESLRDRIAHLGENRDLEAAVAEAEAGGPRPDAHDAPAHGSGGQEVRVRGELGRAIECCLSNALCTVGRARL